MQQFSCASHISTQHKEFVFIGLNNSILDLSMHIMTYKINRDISINFTQEQVSISLSVLSTFLSIWLSLFIFKILLGIVYARERVGTVAKVLCYKSEGRWFDPSWCHWNFSLT